MNYIHIILLLFFFGVFVAMKLLNIKKKNIEKMMNDYNSKELNVLNYNVKMLSSFIFDDEQNLRAKLIPDVIKSNVDPDVIVICEIFDDSSEKILDKGMIKNGYKYISSKVGSSNFNFIKNLSLDDGGVKIYSKWPMNKNKEISIVFSNGSKEDKLSSKGTIFVEIEKMGQKYGIIGTHLQSGRRDIDISNRKTQINEINENIIKKVKDNGYPIIFSGDLNTDFHTQQKDLDYIIDTLNMKYPEITDIINSKKIGTSITDFLKKEMTDKEYNKIVNENKKIRWLDHIMLYNNDITPIKFDVEPVKIQHTDGYNIRKLKNSYLGKLFNTYGKKKKIYDLSDHDGLLAEFKF